MRHALLVAALLSVAAVAPATAQQGKADTAKPYKRVTVAVPILDDSRLAAFRAALADIAARRDSAALAAATVDEGFFWDGDFGGGFEADKSAVQNLTAALSLDAKDDIGWNRLSALAREASAARHPSRQSVICAPAAPKYKDAELERLIKATDTDGIDWAYPRATRLPVHAAPDAGSRVVEKLGPHFVRLRGYEGQEAEPNPERSAWARVETPSGRTGFVAPDTLQSLSVERLCYGKDTNGRWRISGYIGGGD